MTAFLGFLAEEAVWDLEQNAGAVARVLLEPDAAAMLEVHEHRKRIVDHLVRSAALQMGQSSDAARIMLEFGTVEPAGAFP